MRNEKRLHHTIITQRYPSPLCVSPSSGVAECVGDGQRIGVDAVDKLVAHGCDGADLLLRVAVDAPVGSQGRQKIVQAVTFFRGGTVEERYTRARG